MTSICPSFSQVPNPIRRLGWGVDQGQHAISTGANESEHPANERPKLLRIRTTPKSWYDPPPHTQKNNTKSPPKNNRRVSRILKDVAFPAKWMVLLLSLKNLVIRKKIHYRNVIGLLLYSGTFFGGCGSYVFCKQNEYKYSCLFSFYHFKTWNLAIFHRAKEQMGNWKWIISSKFEDE